MRISLQVRHIKRENLYRKHCELSNFRNSGTSDETEVKKTKESATDVRYSGALFDSKQWKL